MPSPSEGTVLQVDLTDEQGALNERSVSGDEARLVPWHRSPVIGQPGVREAPPTGEIARIDRGLPGENPNRLTKKLWQTEVPEPEKVQRRTPQERIQSLTLKLVGQYQKTGTLPDTVLDSLGKELSRLLKREVTGEALRLVAQVYMEEAAAAQRNIDFKKVVNDTYTTPDPEPVLTAPSSPSSREG